MIIITATMFKMYAVILNITHYVFVMLSQNGEQLNPNNDNSKCLSRVSHSVTEVSPGCLKITTSFECVE